jgi:dTDP-4-amino-4,6-dideoxygalactose transaminase
MADMDPILDLCRRHGLFLVEDCAQAHLAELHGRRAGTGGIAATFSFYPGKNLGAYGDAGALITEDGDLAARVRRYANHGALKKHFHEIEGVNSRLDGLHAAILSAKLPHLREWNAQRREVAGWYDQALAHIPGVVRPIAREGAEHIFHLYVIRVEDRDSLAGHLRQRGVESAVHYPTALPFLPAYSRFGHRPEDFPVAHAWQSRILSLPMYPELTREMVEEVARGVREWVAIRSREKAPA